MRILLAQSAWYIVIFLLLFIIFCKIGLFIYRRSKSQLVIPIISSLLSIAVIVLFIRVSVF